MRQSIQVSTLVFLLVVLTGSSQTRAQSELDINKANLTALIPFGPENDAITIDRTVYTCDPNDPSNMAQYRCLSIADACVQENVENRLLHFSTGTLNSGFVASDWPSDQPSEPPVGADHDAYMLLHPDFANNDPYWVYSWSHKHYHFRDYAIYSLVSVGTKAVVELPPSKPDTSSRLVETSVLRG